MSSCLMPMPVSLTETSSRTLPSEHPPFLMLRVTLPLSVYLTAFVSRFCITCSTLTSSPKRKAGTVLSMSASKLKPLLTARSRIGSARLRTRLSVLYLTGTISILPSSILEKSRMELISESRVLLAESILDEYSKVLSSPEVRRIISFIPIMAFIGVRISWDISARKLLLALLAASAAVFSSLSIRASISFCCSRSCNASSRRCS